jgi:hypothetical protein
MVHLAATLMVMAYIVETEQQLQMLKDYETRVYTLTGIRIDMSGKTVSGRVFMWAQADLSSLTKCALLLPCIYKCVGRSHFRIP